MKTLKTLLILALTSTACSANWRVNASYNSRSCNYHQQCATDHEDFHTDGTAEAKPAAFQRTP